MGTAHNGAFKSTDGGATWRAIAGALNDVQGFFMPPDVPALVIDPSNPSTLYAGTGESFGVAGRGIFKSIDAGANWLQINNGLPSRTRVLSLLIDGSSPSTVYAGTSGQGVFKSTDGGTSWLAINTGLTNFTVQALVMDPSNPSTLYAATNGQGVFRSSDSGATWSALNNGLTNLTVLSLAIDPTSPSNLYAGGGGGVFKLVAGATDPPFTSDRDGDGLPLTAQVVEPPFSPEFRKYEGVAHKLTAFPAFTRSYRAIVRPLSQEKWLQLNDPSLGGLNMVTATTRMARYSSGQLIVFSGCKPHFCPNAEVAVAFNPVTGNTWALVRLEDNTSQWLGPENAEIRKILLSLLSEPPDTEPPTEVAQLKQDIERRKLLIPTPPDYLYSADTITGAISTVWIDVTGGVLGTRELRNKYDEFYFAALGYRSMAARAISRAGPALERGDAQGASHYIAEFDRYQKLFTLSNNGAIAAYEGNSTAASTFADGIYKGSKAAVKFGSKFVLGPTGSRLIDQGYEALDFLVDIPELGVKQAAKQAIINALIDEVFEKVPIEKLEGKTISQFLEKSTSKMIGSSGLYDLLDDVFQSPQFEKAFMKVLAEGGKMLANEQAKALVSEMLRDMTIGGKWAPGSAPMKPSVANHAKIPEGVWEGIVQQAGYGSYPVVMEVRAAQANTTAGNTNYPSLGCGGPITFAQIKDGTFVYRENIDRGRGKCIDGGFISLTPNSDGSMDWKYAAPNNPTHVLATAKLLSATRSGIATSAVRCVSLSDTLLHKRICELFNQLRSPTYFEVRTTDVSDELLFNYIAAHERTIEELLWYVNLGLKVQEHINGSATTVEEAKTFLDKVKKAGKTFKEVVEPFARLLVVSTTAAAQVLNMVAVSDILLTGLETYYALANAITKFASFEVLRQYLEVRCGGTANACAPEDSTRQLASDLLRIEAREYVDLIICAKAVLTCPNGTASDASVDALANLYEAYFFGYRLVHYPDSQGIRQEIGRVIAKTANP